MRRMLRSLAPLLVLVVLAAMETGCKGSDDLAGLARQLTVTSQDLSNYYSALAQCVNAEMVVDELNGPLARKPSAGDDLSLLQARLAAFEERRALASHLAALAASMTAFSGNKVPSQMQGAANSVATGLTNLAPLPSGAGPVPATPAGDLTAAWMRGLQAKQARKFAEGFAPLAKALADQFSAEKEGYDAAYHSYIRKAASLDGFLAAEGALKDDSLQSVLGPALRPFALSVQMNPAMKTQLKMVAPKVFVLQAQQADEREMAASAALAASLAQISAEVQQLAAGGSLPAVHPVDLTATETWTKAALKN